MLTKLCNELRNYFVRSDADKHIGTFEIHDGNIVAPFLTNGQYIRIVNSQFNDGVYRYPCLDLTDETFTGAIWICSFPPDIIKLSQDIKEFVNSEAGKPSAYSSESFDEYSYSKMTGQNGVTITWQEVFADELEPYRRMYV